MYAYNSIMPNKTAVVIVVVVVVVVQNTLPVVSIVDCNCKMS